MSTPLSALAPGQRGVIAGFGEIDGLQRLYEMGLIEGTEIELLRRAPTGDPLEVRVMGYSLSLRRAEAERIFLDGVQSA